MPSYEDAVDGAVALHRSGRLADAEAAYRALIAEQGETADLLHLLGVVSGQLGRHADAVGLIGRAIALNPAMPEYHRNLGAAFERLGRTEDAATAYNEMGNIFQRKADFARAVDAHEMALRLVPGAAGTLNDLGAALLRLERYDEAVALLEDAVRRHPQSAEAHNYLGSALHGVGRMDDAIAAYRAALAIEPRFAAALSNIGNALQYKGDFDAALAYYRQAIDAAPDFADAHWNLAHALLSLGKFEEGFREYEWRWRWPGLGEPPRNFAQPLWQGEPAAALAGPLLVITEQGYGDSIQFCRFLPELTARGYRVIFEVARPLYALMWMSLGVHGIRIIPRTDSPAQLEGDPSFAAYVSLLSLPHYLGTTAATIPRKTPYLAVEPGRVEAWRKRLGRGFHVGLAWAGRPEHIRNRERSIRFRQLAPLFAARKARFWSLQKGPAEAQAIEAGSSMTLLGEELVDFGETAALIEALDLVVAVDSAVVHLAGALGRPVWALIHAAADWRWQLGRRDSPWYPTLRIFRQDRPGDWDGAIEKVATELARNAAP